MKYLYCIAMLTVFLSLPSLSCSDGHPEPYFPPHQISYEPGRLKIEDGDTMHILLMEDISLSGYPHLQLRQGLTLKRAVLDRSGGDYIGHVVAIADNSSKGFVVETMDGKQGGFLFAPLTSNDAVLEYVEFMFHEPPVSEYDREHRYITSQDGFNEALAHFGKYTFTKTPPVSFTRITGPDGGRYLVELVYRSELYVERITYMACYVTIDGDTEYKDGYIFVEGPPGAVL